MNDGMDRHAPREGTRDAQAAGETAPAREPMRAPTGGRPPAAMPIGTGAGRGDRCGQAAAHEGAPRAQG